MGKNGSTRTHTRMKPVPAVHGYGFMRVRVWVPSHWSHCHIITNNGNYHQPPPFVTHKQGSAKGEGSSGDTGGCRRDGPMTAIPPKYVTSIFGSFYVDLSRF